MLMHLMSAWFVMIIPLPLHPVVVLCNARLVPPECLSALSRFDRALERLVCHSLDAPAECASTLSTTRSLINLPMRWGGHGCEGVVSLSNRAYLASWLHCVPQLVDLYPRMRDWASGPIATSVDAVANCLAQRLDRSVSAWSVITSDPSRKPSSKSLVSHVARNG